MKWALPDGYDWVAFGQEWSAKVSIRADRSNDAAVLVLVRRRNAEDPPPKPSEELAEWATRHARVLSESVDDEAEARVAAMVQRSEGSGRKLSDQPELLRMLSDPRGWSIQHSEYGWDVALGGGEYPVATAEGKTLLEALRTALKRAP